MTQLKIHLLMREVRSTHMETFLVMIASPGSPKMEPVAPAVAEKRDVPEVKKGTSPKAGMKPPPHNASVAGDVEMDRATSSAPLEIVSREDLEFAASSRPTKQAPTDANKRMALHEQCEDEELVLTFGEAEADLLEEYDEGLKEPDFERTDELRLANGLLESLMLVRLDAVADGIEVERLKTMGVLEEFQDAHETSTMKSLSTRFVRTWWDKTFGSRRVWFAEVVW